MSVDPSPGLNVVVRHSGRDLLLCTVKDGPDEVVLTSRLLSGHHWTLVKDEMLLQLLPDRPEGSPPGGEHVFIVDRVVEDEQGGVGGDARILGEGLPWDRDGGVGFPPLRVRPQTLRHLRAIDPRLRGSAVKLRYDGRGSLLVHLATERPPGGELVRRAAATLSDGRTIDLYVLRTAPEGSP